METNKWKKDKTPYYIFACVKCGRTLYVKTTQKTKKCLNCMRIHHLAKLPDTTEVIYGLNNTINAVKDKQHTLAIKETGHTPDLRSNNEFRVRTHPAKPSNFSKTLLGVDHGDSAYVKEFKTLLLDLFSKFKEFPQYMIHIMSSEYHIPDSEIPLLLSRFIHNGMLIALPNDYFTLLLKRKNGDYVN